MMLIIKKHGAPTLHTLEGGRQVTLYALCHVSAVTSSSCQRAAHRPCGSQPAWRSPAARPRASPAPRSRRVAREAWGARPKALGVKARPPRGGLNSSEPPAVPPPAAAAAAAAAVAAAAGCTSRRAGREGPVLARARAAQACCSAPPSAAARAAALARPRRKLLRAASAK